MVRNTALLATTAALALSVHAEGLYSKKSAVLQINGPDYDRLIAKSNYTSIVEFYAPWCGHCKNLKPAYETAAKSLAGIAKVAAVNCDDEMNKPFCGQMGVQGFPTLKIVRPGKKPGRPIVEDYQGPRAAKGIVDAVKDKIPNTVKKITDQNLDGWIQENKDAAKAILFSDKGLVSATLRALAIDFAGIVSIGQARKSEKATVTKYGITEFPSLILLPAGSTEPMKFKGEVKKDELVKFLSQIAPPNPDCPPPKAKKPKAKKDDKKASKSSSKYSKASESHKSADASSAAASATQEVVEEPVVPTESPNPNMKTDKSQEPIILPKEELKPTIPIVSEAAEVQSLCLNEKSKTCVLAILPSDVSSEAVTTAIASLAAIHKKHDTVRSHLFPFVGLSASNPVAALLLKQLSLGSADQVHLVATHGKRAWFKKYPGSSFGAEEVEQWVDALRMGEGKKEKLPEGIIVAAKEETRKEQKKPILQGDMPAGFQVEDLGEYDGNEHPHNEL